MTYSTIGDLLAFLDRLKNASIYYSLADPTAGAVMVQIAVPGERWEIEFHADGSIGVEVFVSRSGVVGTEMFDELFRRFSDSGSLPTSKGG